MKTIKNIVFKTCPQTGRIRGINSSARLFKLLFPITGLIALLWVLGRIIPKPSRINYPCMQVAAPHAGLFLSYVAIIIASIFSFKKFRKLFNRKVYLGASACLFVSLALLSSLIRQNSIAMAPTPVPNNPIGIGRGIFPGRVVWSFDREATSWPGRNIGHWWDDQYTDRAVVEQMVQEMVKHISENTDEQQAWDQIFRYFNREHGKGDIGYLPGEKIMIKVNFVGFQSTANRVDTETYLMNSEKNRIHASPQLLLAILGQLVNNAGVSQENIYVGDIFSLFPKDFYDMLAPEFPNVNYIDYFGGNAENPRTGIANSAVRLHWSTETTGLLNDYIPTAFADTDYNINIANLKDHTSAGFTLCAKNHYGSLTRRPIDEGFYNLHDSLAGNAPEYGQYRALVDLMGHPDMGGKTLLYMVDGLYGGKLHEPWPFHFQSSPFNGDWTSSLFASQDGVALDSVLLDLLRNEWPEGNPNLAGSDDYLIEAALADNPPSGTFYDPAGDGSGLSSLGVHEHWNNADEKLYSINLGYDEGIELVTISSDELEALSFTLMDADTDQPIPHYNPIPEGAIINLASIALPENLSIRANTTPATGLDKVTFHLNGELANEDSLAPYAFSTEMNGDYTPWQLGTGSYELISQLYLNGNIGTEKRLNFTLIDAPVTQGFCLIDADTDLPVPGYERLTNGETLNLANLPSHLNIQVLTDPVDLLDQTITFLVGTGWKVDKNYPYTYGEEFLGDFLPLQLEVGTHKLRCNTYMNGDIFSTFETTINIINNDTEPPTPNPSEWAVAPQATGSSEITMTAVTASDPNGVEYSFWGQTNGATAFWSGWISSANYTASNLQPDTEYIIMVKTRDRLGHSGSWSTEKSVITQDEGLDVEPPTPNPAEWEIPPTAISETEITMTATTASDPSGGVQYSFWGRKEGASAFWSGWIDSSTYLASDLEPDTEYVIMVQSRDHLGNTGDWSATTSATTLDNGPDVTPPSPSPSEWAETPPAISSTEISMKAVTATDPSGGVQYSFWGRKDGASAFWSGWIDSSTYLASDLEPGTEYVIIVQSRDHLGNTGDWSAQLIATTTLVLDTEPPTPNPAEWEISPTAMSGTEITMTAVTGSDPSGGIQYSFWGRKNGDHAFWSGWVDSSTYTASGLQPNTEYVIIQQTRDKLKNTGLWSAPTSATTLP